MCPYIRLYVCLSAHQSLPPEAPQRLTQASQRLTQASKRLAQASWRLALRGLSQPLTGLMGGTYVWTDIRTNGHTDSPCILQDIVSFGSI